MTEGLKGFLRHPAGLRWRLIVLLWGVTSFALAGQTLAWLSSEITELEHRIGTEGTVLAQGLANACSPLMEDPAEDRFDYLIKRTGRTVDMVDVTFANRRGQIVGHSDKTLVGQMVEGGPVGVFGALRQSAGLFGAFGAGRLFRVTAPVLRGTTVLGFVVVRFRSEEVRHRALELVRTAFAAATFWLLIGAVAGALFVRRITRPLGQLADAAEAISADDLDVQLLPESEAMGEIGVLQKSFGRLLEALRVRRDENMRLMEEQRGFNKELRSRVHEVTADLRETSSHLESIIRAMQAGIIACDSEGEIVRLNAGVHRQLHGIAEAREGMHLRDAVPRADLIERAFDLAMDESRSSTLDIRVDSDAPPWREPDSPEIGLPTDVRYLTVRVNPLSDAGNRPKGAVITVVDVTDRRRLAVALRRRDRLASLGTIAAGLAHELGNSMHAIYGFSKLLLTSMSEADPHRVDVEAIHRDNLDAINLLDRFLQFARVREGQLEARPVIELVNQALSMCDYRLRKAGVELVTELEFEDAHVRCDPQPLTQVFVNIVLNAADAMEQSETRRLTVSLTRRSRLRMRIRFADTGPGIADEHAERIFDPFFTTKTASGTGLGLAIAHQVVQRHGGRLTSSTHAGSGAIFDVDLPIQREPEVAS